MIRVGDICLYKENCRNKSYCEKENDNFNYYGIQNSLYRKTGTSNPFTPKQIFVFQMTMTEDQKRIQREKKHIEDRIINQLQKEISPLFFQRKRGIS